MKSIVTGGAGFIGSHLCDYLLQKGHEVLCIDNLITGSVKNIKHLEHHDRFVFLDKDITKDLSIDKDIDYIFHFASPASPVDYYKYSLETLRVGSIGTENMLKIAKDQDARFMLASTSEVYGDPVVNPQPEEYWGNVNPIGPRSVYDEAKRYAEAITMNYHRLYDLDTRIIRIFNTYGPRMKHDDGRAVPNFIDQALKNKPLTIYGDGSQTRSFCYISDEIKGIYSLMMKKYHLPVNIGNPEEYTILKLAYLIQELCDCNSELIYQDLPIDDPKQRKPDITKAKDLLNWEPKYDIKDGLRETIEWFKTNE